MKYVVGLFALLALINEAKADLAVRDSSISESEFRAQTMAAGHTPISDWLMSESQRPVSSELGETFRRRLIDAQKEWIERTSETTMTPDIDRFLTLANEADWTKADREAFAVFFARKFEASQGDAQARIQFRNYMVGEKVDLQAMSPARQSEWISSEAQDQATWVSLASRLSTLPPDVIAVSINGRPFERDRLTNLKVPTSPFRLTLISNLYQPLSLKIESIEATISIPNRNAWLNEQCRLSSTASTFEDDIQIQPITNGNCATLANELPKTKLESELTSKFGIQNTSMPALGLGAAMPDAPATSRTSILKKPWFWGAVGVLAIGAVIAIERNQNQSQVRAVQREGW